MAETVRFTASELWHILSLLEDALREGSYYGHRAQYWRRHERIWDKLDTAYANSTGAPLRVMSRPAGEQG
jgi:hypothetical protein